MYENICNFRHKPKIAIVKNVMIKYLSHEKQSYEDCMQCYDKTVCNVMVNGMHFMPDLGYDVQLEPM